MKLTITYKVKFRIAGVTLGTVKGSGSIVLPFVTPPWQGKVMDSRGVYLYATLELAE